MEKMLEHDDGYNVCKNEENSIIVKLHNNFFYWRESSLFHPFSQLNICYSRNMVSDKIKFSFHQ